MAQVFFVSGIDTDCGKTITTGFLLKYLKNKGIKAISQKMVQTGCTGISEDILIHRKIAGDPLSSFDLNKTTCPYVLQYPSSPHLAAAKENISINIDKIDKATSTLSEEFDIVLIEGAGGLFVPISNDYNIFDFIKKHSYPLILVSSAKIGSINHTIMSLELCRMHGVKIQGLIYNHFPSTDQNVIRDSKLVFERYLKKHAINCSIFDVPQISEDYQIELDFENLF